MVSGLTQHYYYTIPSDLDLITTAPTREAIFQYLSQVKYEDFPEFILDILLKVEGHISIDITDGPGDEKQDILTINPQGKRCLTQCKHKNKLDGKYSGDELDRIVAACLRKNCDEAYFVTNGDLSPQAKGYVTDKEFLRGWPDKENPLIVDYWNGFKIWEKIKANQDILNKWFSGMGQSHGLRNFKFCVSFLKMPFKTISTKEDFNSIMNFLIDKDVIKKTDEENAFTSTMPNGIQLHIEKWFQFVAEANLQLNTPVNDEGFWYSPQYALVVKVEIPEIIGKYAPATIKQNIIDYLFRELPTVDSKFDWWHIIISQGKSFIFLHDISEPRQIILDSSLSFVNVEAGLFSESNYCGLDSSEFKVKTNIENEESIWIHKSSEIEVIQLFEQSLNPTETYHYQRVQLNKLSSLSNYEFRAVQNIDSTQAMRIRRILDHEWVAFSQNEDTLIWCFPPDTSAKKVELIEKKLQVHGLKVLHIRDTDKEEILKSISKDIPPVSLITTTELKDASIPIDLLRRGFWLNKNLKLKRKIDENDAMELLKFKFTYENSFGYDHMNGKTTLKSHTSELPNILCDLFTVRCNQMIDIAILSNPININFRFFLNSTDSSTTIALKGIEEFKMIFQDVKSILKRISI